jgi:hypothetical protein
MKRDSRTRTTPILAAVMALGFGRGASAADLLEPFDPGFSDLELHWSGDLGADDHGAVGVLGFGLGGGVSLALQMEGAAGEVGSSAVSLVFSRSLGRAGELDAWLGRGLGGELAGALELGLEWSRDFGGAVPYARIGWHRGGDGGVVALLGVALDRERTDYHLELAVAPPEADGRPLRLAFGPNVALGEGAELIPELALVRDPSTGDFATELSLGVVLCPGTLGLR